MIVVAGGSGRLGTLLVNRLVARGSPVRVLTRSRERAAHLDGALVEIVVGDVRVAADVQRAVDGATVVVSAVHGFAGPGGVSPASVDRDGNRHLVDAAVRTGATVILMSVVGAAADSPMELFRMKYAAEQHLRAHGTAWTIVRSTAFLEVWIALMSETMDRAGRVMVFGRGENPINFVSVRDVAALVDRVIADPGVRGQTVEIGGPENLTFTQLATAIQSAGPAVGPRHVPRAALRAMSLLLRPVWPERARQGAAALALDTMDLRFDPTATRARYPEQSLTPLSDVLARRAR
jgi:uncharacterized protein YbjT (DUF2867 family)